MALDDVGQLEIVEMGAVSPNTLTLIGEESDLAELPGPVRGWIQRLQAENVQLRARQEAMEKALRAEHRQLELRVASLEGAGRPAPPRLKAPLEVPRPSSRAPAGTLTRAMDDAADEEKADEVPAGFSEYPRSLQRSASFRAFITWWSSLFTILFLALYYADLVTDIANFLSFQAAYDFPKTRWDSQWCNVDPYLLGTTNRACTVPSMDCHPPSLMPPPFAVNATSREDCPASCYSCFGQTCMCRFGTSGTLYCVNKVSQSFEYLGRVLFIILLTKEAFKAVGFFVMFFLSVRTRESVYFQFFLNNVFSGLFLLIYRGRYLAFLRKHRRGPFAVRVAFLDLVLEDIPQLYFTIALMYYVGDYGSAINLAACIVSSLVTFTQAGALLYQLVRLLKKFCSHAATIQL